MMRWAFISAVALALVGCHRAPLSCRSEYLYPTYLASEQVNTPDPCRECFYGQQIVVRWKLPTSFFTQNISSPPELLLAVRYGNREIEHLSTPLTQSQGFWVYRVVNREYWCRGGILAFQAHLVQNGEVIDTWTHSLWAELIEISPDD